MYQIIIYIDYHFDMIIYHLAKYVETNINFVKVMKFYYNRIIFV